MSWRSATVLTVCLLAAPGTARGQEKFDPTKWEWLQEVLLPAKAAGRYFAFTAPPQVLSRAKPDLTDLRLLDGDNKLVPHAVRVRHPEYRVQEVRVKQRFDEARDKKKGYTQVRVELDAVGDGKHNDIEVETSGVNYRRLVEVLGADTADFKDPQEVAKGPVLRYDVEGGVARVNRLRYAPKSYRYLQVRVHADGDEPPPEIERVTVRHTVAVPGELVTLAAQLGPRQPVRGDGGPGSAWFIDFGMRSKDKDAAGERIPVERLTFEAEEQDVVRPFRIEVTDEDQRHDVFGAEWRWRARGGRRVLEIDFPEVRASRLRLVVTDFANPPLNFRSVEYSAAARQVVFAQKRYAEPLRLYYGNPTADPPNYDFERTLPAALTPAPEAVQLGKGDRNPAYMPPPRPLSERAPWLIYLALGAASLALLAVLFVLARQAIARHDAARAAVGEPEASAPGGEGPTVPSGG